MISNNPLSPSSSPLKRISSAPQLTSPQELTETPSLKRTSSESTIIKPKTPLLGGESEGQTIRSKVDEIPSETMLSESSSAPKPSLLVHSLEKMDSKKELVLLTETAKVSEKPYHPSDLITPSVTEANGKFAKTFLEVSKSKDLSLFLANNLKTSLERLRKADSGFNRQQKIANEVEQAKLDAQALMQAIGSNSDVSFLLKGKSDEELKTIVTDSLQKMMGYSEKEMGSLSEKKQQWIQAVVAGIKEGFIDQPPGEGKGQIARALDEVTSSVMQNIQSQDPKTPLSVEMGLKTHGEILEDVKKALGHTRPEVYNAMAKGIEAGLPKILDMDEMTGRFTRIEFGGTQFEKVGVVGKGQCGDVLLMKDPESGKQYVLKGLNRLDAFKNEVMNQMQAQKQVGDGVLKIEGVFSTGEFVYTLTELAPGGEYKDNILGLDRTVNNGLVVPEFAQKMKLNMGLESAQILLKFQETGMLHNDIKPENFIRGVDGTLKLADFGESRGIDRDLPRATGTPGLMPSEVYDKDKPVTQKVDQFSYGVMLYQSLYNAHPFGDGNPNELVTNVENYGKGLYQLDLSHIENPKLKELFEGLLAVDPDKRPSFDGVVKTLKEVMGPVDDKQVSEFRKAVSDYDKAVKTHEKSIDEELDKTGAPLGQIYQRISKFETDIRYYLKPGNENPEQLETCRQSLKEWQNKLEERNVQKEQLMSTFLQTDTIKVLAAKVSYWTNPSKEDMF